MRIAFVGKGGSGKSTVSSLFASYIANNRHQKVFLFDADLNVNTPKLLGINLDRAKFLSEENCFSEIKEALKDALVEIHTNQTGHATNQTESDDQAEHANKNIAKNIIKAEDIRKIHTIEKDNLLDLNDESSFVHKYLNKKDNIYLGAVGTYDEKEIGRSCYHYNLSIFEIILNHFTEKDSYLVADMVAGIDAFSNTLHVQFDILCLIVEPTHKSIDVFNRYSELAKISNIYENVFVVVNKIEDEADLEFVQKNIPEEKIIGYIKKSKYLKGLDMSGGALDIEKIDEDTIHTLSRIEEKLLENTKDASHRIYKVKEIASKYKW